MQKAPEKASKTIQENIYLILDSAIQPSLQAWCTQTVHTDDQILAKENKSMDALDVAGHGAPRKRRRTVMYIRSDCDSNVAYMNIYRVFLIVEQFQIDPHQPLRSLIAQLSAALQESSTMSSNADPSVSAKLWGSTHQSKVLYPHVRQHYIDVVHELEQDFDSYVTFLTDMYTPALQDLHRRNPYFTLTDAQLARFRTSVEALRWEELTTHRYWTPSVQHEFREQNRSWPWLGITRLSYRDSQLGRHVGRAITEAHQVKEEMRQVRARVSELVSNYVATDITRQTLALLSAHQWTYLVTCVERILATITSCVANRPTGTALLSEWREQPLDDISNYVYTLVSKACESPDVGMQAISSDWIHAHDNRLQRVVRVTGYVHSHLHPAVQAQDTTAETWTLEDMIARVRSVQRDNPRKRPARRNVSNMSYKDVVAGQMNAPDEQPRAIPQKRRDAIMGMIRLKRADYEKKNTDRVLSDLDFLDRCVTRLLSTVVRRDQREWLRSCNTFVLTCKTFIVDYQRGLGPVTFQGLERGAEERDQWEDKQIGYEIVKLIRDPYSVFHDMVAVKEIRLDLVRRWLDTVVQSIRDQDRRWIEQEWIPLSNNDPFRCLQTSCEAAHKDITETLAKYPSVQSEELRLNRLVGEANADKLLASVLPDLAARHRVAETTHIFFPVEEFIRDFKLTTTNVSRELLEHHWDVGAVPCPPSIPRHTTLCHAVAWIFQCSAHTIWMSAWLRGAQIR